MLNIPETIKDLFRANNLTSETARHLKLRFYNEDVNLLFPEDALFPSDDLFPIDQEPFYVIDNTQISTESMIITESLCEYEDLKFGECNAAQFEITVADVLVDLTGKEFMVTVEIGDYEMALGIYRVKSFVRQADRRMKKITAYNRMNNFQVDVSSWYNGLTFPMTLKAFRASLCNYCGVKQLIADLPLDDMQVTKSISPEQLSGLDVMQAICEINGCFGQIDRTGRMKYVFLEKAGLYPAESLFPDDDLFPRDLLDGENTELLSKYKQSDTTYEDYLVSSISRVQLRQEEGDVGATYGNEGNCYVVEGNFLSYGKSSEELLQIASELYDKISGIMYRPCNIVTAALPWVEPGDGIVCYTTDDVIETYCLKRVTNGIQGMMDTFSASGNIEQEESFGLQMQIIQLEGKSAVIKKSVEEVSVKVTDLKDYTEAQFKITSDEILAEVKRAEQAEAEIIIKADNISMSVSNLAESTMSKFDQVADAFKLTVSKGEVSSQLSIELDKITLSGNRLIVNSTNFQLDGNGNATFSGKIKGASLEGTLISSSEMFSVMDDGSENYEIDCGGFAFYDSGSDNVFADMIDETVGMADGGTARLWIGGNHDNPETYFDENGEMYPGDSWWDGWSLTRTIRELWEYVHNGGWNPCSSDDSCGSADGCDADITCSSDGSCDSDDLTDDVGACGSCGSNGSSSGGSGGSGGGSGTVCSGDGTNSGENEGPGC